MESVNGPLWVRVLAPTDGQVVATPSIEVRGEATAETILSINDEILLVENDQAFTVTIPLEEGPNVIELVASDYLGNEISMIFTVTYQP